MGDATGLLPVCRCGLERVKFWLRQREELTKGGEKGQPYLEVGLQVRCSWGLCIRMPEPPPCMLLCPGPAFSDSWGLLTVQPYEVALPPLPSYI